MLEHVDGLRMRNFMPVRFLPEYRTRTTFGAEEMEPRSYYCLISACVIVASLYIAHNFFGFTGSLHSLTY